MPVRVAYVIGELDKGGAEYQLAELVRHLDRRRFTPQVFVLAGEGYWVGPIREAGIAVHPFPRRGSADLGRLARLRAALRAFAPDVLHTVLWSGNCYGRLAAAGLGIPVVVAAERNVIRRPAWQARLERLLDRMTDAYLVNSDAIVAELVDHGGLPRAKMTVVRNGIDLARLPPFVADRRAARAALGFAPDRRLVAQVGRLTAQKDYPTYLAAAASVAAARPDVDFLVVGEGEERAALAARAAAVGLAERVRFLGLRHDVPALLGAVDVLALTSRWEGLPNVVIEAMATGAVAVATDVGGCRELLGTDARGLVVPPGDAAATAAAIRRALDDSALAARLATAARRFVEDELAIDATTARTVAVYERLLAATGRAAA